MTPLRQYFLRVCSRVHCCPQRAWTPDPPALPLQTSRFRGPRGGAMIAILDPRIGRRATSGRTRCPRRGSTCARRERQTSPSLPQRARIPDPPGLFPANRSFPGATRGGHDRLLGPSRTTSGRRRCPRRGSTCPRCGQSRCHRSDRAEPLRLARSRCIAKRWPMQGRSQPGSRPPSPSPFARRGRPCLRHADRCTDRSDCTDLLSGAFRGSACIGSRWSRGRV
jgi:hypothetical protein